MSTLLLVYRFLFLSLHKSFFPLFPPPAGTYAAGTQTHTTSSQEPLAHFENAWPPLILPGLEEVPVKQKAMVGFLPGFLVPGRNPASLWLAARQCDRAGKQQTPGTWPGAGDSTGPRWNASSHPHMKEKKQAEAMLPYTGKANAYTSFYSLHAKGPHSFITAFNKGKFPKYMFIKYLKLLLSPLLHFSTRKNYSRAF